MPPPQAGSSAQSSRFSSVGKFTDLSVINLVDGSGNLSTQYPWAIITGGCCFYCATRNEEVEAGEAGELLDAVHAGDAITHIILGSGAAIVIPGFLYADGLKNVTTAMDKYDAAVAACNVRF